MLNYLAGDLTRARAADIDDHQRRQTLVRAARAGADEQPEGRRRASRLRLRWSSRGPRRSEAPLSS